MARSEKQKQKILRVKEYFERNTDENHKTTINQIIEHLSAEDIAAVSMMILERSMTALIILRYCNSVNNTGLPTDCLS